MTRFPSRIVRTTAVVCTAVAMVLASGTASGGAPSATAVAATDAGDVRGVAAGSAHRFLGVPYAAAPVGALRWRPPHRPAPWAGVRDARRPANRCAQGTGVDTPPDVSEDCLYLDVTAPRRIRRDRPRPVFVWLHGGGFVAGSGSEYDGRKLAVEGDAVVVTVNYRLGVFGFFGHPGLAGSGTFALQDQQAALGWVRRNAAAFGGDPRRVTLIGQSAGAMAVCAQLTSPSAAGLFDRAIVQSGACTVDWPRHGLWPDAPAGGIFTPVADVNAIGTVIAARHGCADPATAVACLRRVPMNALLADEVAAGLPGPAYGGPILPVEPGRALGEGRFHRVPVLIGTNRDEARLHVGLLWPQPTTVEDYRTMLAEAFGDRADEVAARYRPRGPGGPAVAWAAVLTDRVWACPTLRAERLLARHTPTFAYEFADRTAPAFTEFPAGFPPGAHHSAELAYLFEDVAGFAPDLTRRQATLSRAIVRYWARFAAAGSPDHPTVWPRFTVGAPYVRSLGPDRDGRAPYGAAHRCAFWEGQPAAEPEPTP